MAVISVDRQHILLPSETKPKEGKPIEKVPVQVLQQTIFALLRERWVISWQIVLAYCVFPGPTIHHLCASTANNVSGSYAANSQAICTSSFQHHPCSFSVMHKLGSCMGRTSSIEPHTLSILHVPSVACFIYSQH